MTPEGWSINKGECLFTLGGGHAPSDLHISDDGDILYLKVDDFNDPRNANGLMTSKLRFSLDVHNRSILVYEPGTIVFPKRGAAIFKNRVQILGKHASVDSNLMCLSPKGVQAQFLRYYLEFYGLHRISDNSGVPQINNKHLYPMMFPCPPLPEQKKIAAILVSVDEAIAATQAVIDQTRKVKQGLLQQLLTRGIGHTRFKKTEIGEIPEEWEVSRTDQMGEVSAGRQRSPHFTEGTIRPYLRVANVFDGYIDASDVLTMLFTDNEYERYRLRAGDILLNEGQSRELVGRCAVYRGHPEACCFQNTLVRFRPHDGTDCEFAHSLFQHLHHTGVFASIATQTTSVAHLGVSRFASLRVPVPPKHEQIQISRIVGGYIDALDAGEEHLHRLTNLKRGLMQDLLTGRIRVKGVA